jgi:4-carboxymuconolactone decarboxylase
MSNAKTRTQTITIAPCRMPPIPKETMTEAQKKAAAGIEAGPRGGVMGPFVAILRSPGLTEHAQRLGAYIRWECKLDLRIAELAGLMTARYWQQQYEFFVHIPHALKAGVAQATIDAIAEGRRPDSMPADEAITWEFVSEFYANKAVSDTTYAKALAQFGDESLMDLLGVMGYYSMIAMVMNVARTEIPDGKPLPLAPLQDHVVRS